jgi:hypothetical protein
MANEKKSNIKNLTLGEMKKQVKKLEARTDHEVKVGEDVYKVSIDNVFIKTKQYALLDDMVHFLKESSDNPDILDYATPYTTLLMVKHFTSIEVSDNIDEAIELLNILIDLDLLNQVLNLLPEDEIVKMYEILSSTTKRMTESVEKSVADAEKKALEEAMAEAEKELNDDAE